MSPDKSPKALFIEALEREDPVERARFLDEACETDTALRERVERLLCAHDEAGGFFSQPSKVSPSTRASGTKALPLTEKAGDKIGRYKLLQQIGEGGCGVVYMAEQEEPVRRRVALKVIKLGMDTKQVIARFEAERQALAMMDHPNIARVLDAGATDSGRPFFVMELVRGTKISEFCDEKELSTQERLDLFLKVCSAIQHAHQKGVIHRDVKPSNILVTVVDGVAVPKVIDFGVAKATNNQPLTDKTLFTAFEQFIGTPAYMSPEQAELSGVDIDTRTDIYSLGVVLYELLTGGPPFDQKQLLASGLDAMRRTIREAEPPRPSNRLSTMAAMALTATAQRRHTEPPKLIHQVRGDLDWIAMKCLEKDRARRYETANALAADIRRHLENEPVVARPPSRLYEFQKTVKRHKFGFAAASAVMVALAIGFAISTWQFVQKNRAYQRASAAEQEQTRLRHEEAAQRRRAEGATVGEMKQRERAEAQEALAREQLYAASISLAHRAWEEGDVARMAEVLNSLVPGPGKEDLRGFEWHYLQRLIHPENSTIRHGAQARAVAFAPDGKLIASAGSDLPPAPRSWDGTIPGWVTETNWMRVAIWDRTSGKETSSLRGHQRMVHGLAFSPDNTLLASAGADKQVRIWRLPDGREQATLAGHEDEVACVAFSPNGTMLASGAGRPRAGFGANQTSSLAENSGTEEEIRLWDPGKGELLRRLPGHRNGVMSLAFDPQGKTLASVGLDGWVKMWDVATGELRNARALGVGRLFSVAVSPDGKFVAIGGSAGYLSLWSPNPETLEHVPTRHQQVFAVAFSPEGGTVATAGYDKTVKLWDLRGRIPRMTLRSHQHYVWDLAFAPDGKTLASASWDGSVKLWNSAEAATYRASAESTDGIAAMEFAKDGNQIATASAGKVEIWNVNSLKRSVALAALVRPGVSVYCLGFAPDGTRLAAGATDGRVQIWSTEDWRAGPIIQTLGQIWGLAFSPDSGTLVTASRKGRVEYWSAQTGERLGSVTELMDLAGYVAFSPDGKTLGVSGRTPNPKRCVLHLWHWPERQLRRTFPLDASSPFAFSPDGRILARGSPYDGRVQFWDAETGVLRAETRAHSDCVWKVSFSPDSRTFATASWDGTVRLWHAPTSQELFAFAGYNGSQTFAASFSPDGRRLASGGVNGRVVLWETAIEPAKDIALKVSHGEPSVEAGTRLPADATHLVAQADATPFTGPLAHPFSQPASSGPKSPIKRESLLHLPPRDPKTPPELLDLSAFYNADPATGWHDRDPNNSLSSLPRGLQTFAGVQFDVRGLIQLGCTKDITRTFPSKAEGIPVGRTCRRLRFLHAACTSYGTTNGTVIGQFVVHQENQPPTILPIRFGLDVRDWEVHPKQEPQGQDRATIAWRGHNDAGRILQLFTTTWDNPHPQVKVDHLDYVSAMSSAAPFLLAITAEP